MALTIRRAPSARGRVVATLVALFALVAQPMYGLVANALGAPVVVNSSSLAGWTISATDGGTATFVKPVGETISALKIGLDNGSSRVRLSKDVAVPLSAVSDISFRGKLVSGPAGSANTAFRLGIDYDGAGPGDTQWIVYETYYNFDGVNTTNSTASWQTWNVKDGKFWGSWNSGGGYTTNKTLTEILATNPDAVIRGISVGMGAQGFTLTTPWQSLVDSVNFNGTTYDFEADLVAGPSLLSPANGATYKTSNLPQNQTWSAVPGATRYLYESYRVNPETNPGAVASYRQERTVTNRTIGNTADEGTHYWRVKAIAPFESAWSSVRSFTIDNIGPEAPVLDNSPVFVGSGHPTGVPATWTHNGEDVAYYEYREYRTKALADSDVDANVNGEAGAYWVPNRTSTNAGNRSQIVGHSWTVSRNLYYRVVAIDAMGNRSASSTVGTVIIDKDAPTASITSATVTGDTISFEGSVSDANLNYYYCWLTTNQIVTVDGHTYTPGQEVRLNGDADSARNAACNTVWAGGETSFSGTLGGFTTANFPAGSYTINLVAYDKAGNSNVSTPATYDVTIEEVVTEPPVDTGSNPGGNINSNQGTGGESPVTTESIPDNNPTQLGIVAQLPFASIISGTGDNTQDSTPNTNSSDVLGEQDSETVTPLRDTGEVLGLMDSKLLGLAWYWWLAIVAAIVGGWLLLAAAIRRQRSEGQ